MIFLENDHISTCFASKGAELQSVKSKRTNKEYLWSGDPQFWGKYSPVLFPVVGGLKDNTYYFEGREYHLSRHGFARDNEFETNKVDDTEVIFTLHHNEKTLQVYPFPFILKIRYKLSGNQLSCTYQVLNPGTNPLYFSVGGHPAFAADCTNGLKYSDYYLEFNKDKKLVYHKIKDDLIDDNTLTIDLKDGILPLSHDLFYEDALVLKTLQSNCISLRNNKNETGLHFRFNDFPFFGIWAARDADFVCLEPWCGIADGINHNQELKQKEGIMVLSAGSKWERGWNLECF